MKFKVTAAVVVLSALPALPRLMAQGCPCPTSGFAEVAKNADTIFVGKSLSATNDSKAPAEDGAGGWTGPREEFQTRLTFDVQTVVKGKLPRFVEVVTPTGICGFSFSVGEEYLVVGMLHGTVVATDACKGNASGSDLIELRTAEIRETLQEKDR